MFAATVYWVNSEILLHVSCSQVCHRRKRSWCVWTSFSVQAFQINVSLKVRECENYRVYYMPLEVISWNKCDVHTVVIVVGKLQQKLKCRGWVSSKTRVFTILIGKSCRLWLLVCRNMFGGSPCFTLQWKHTVYTSQKTPTVPNTPQSSCNGHWWSQTTPQCENSS